MRPPSGVNLTALDSRLSRICLSLRSSATISPSRGSTSMPSVMPCRCARSRISVIALESADGRSNVDSSSSMRPASTFDRSRMSLMRLSRCRPDEWMSLQVVVLLLVDVAEQALEQHFGKADDGVERRAQLVRHVGEELRLVLVRDLELPALVLDLAEQARVLDRDDGLVRERLRAARCPSRRTGRRSRARRGSRRSPRPSHSIGAKMIDLIPIALQARRVVAGTPSPASTSGKCTKSRRTIAVPVPVSSLTGGERPFRAFRDPARGMRQAE